MIYPYSYGRNLNAILPIQLRAIEYYKLYNRFSYNLLYVTSSNY